MIDLGIVRPGSTIRIPFSSFDKDDGSAITMTNFAAADILIYKDGGTTERASTAGFTATTDFDAKTGKHVAIIDLADNTTSGFFNAGSEYMVAIDSVTIDAVTTGGWIARFKIGYAGALIDTTIATLSSQTSFTLTSGPAEDNALNDMWVLIHDIASAVQIARAIISGYTGATKTVTLAAAPTFTIAAGDNISIMGPMPMQPATAGRKPVVDTAGLVDANMVKVGPTGSGTAQTAKDIGGAVPAAAAGASGGLLISGSNAGTTTLGALTVTGATTLTGNMALADGLTIAAPSTANRAGLAITGNGTGAGAVVTGGATGIGLSVVGGGTSGDGIKVATTSGHGLNLAPVGTSKHGIFATGGNGGTSDGISAVAGTGGVPIRGDITGNITGSLSGSAGSVTGAVGSVAGNVGGNVVGSVASVSGAVASVTGNVGGNVTGSVGSVASGGITRASLAADTGLVSIRSNTAQAGASTTITLDASASSVNDFYTNDLVLLTGGTGVGQARYITAYNGTSKVATVTAWKTNPDATTTFAVIGADAIVGATAPTAAQVATAVWTDLLAGSDFSTATSIGKLLKDDIDAAISSRMATYTQPTGFLAATFPGTVASTTNITAGTITTVTNLTNAPTAGDLTATMKASVTTAATAATPTIAGYTGNTPQTGDAYARLGAPAGASVSADIAAAKADTAAIKAKTDSLTFTVAGMADANVVDWKGATAPAMTGDAFARIGAAGAGLTALGDTRIANLDATVSSRLPTSSYTAPLSAAATANAVWDEATAGHGTAGTTGKALTDAGAAGTPLDAAGVRAAIGMATANLDTQLAAGAQDATVAKASALSTAQTAITAIKAKTDPLTFTVANQLDANVQYVNDAEVSGTGTTGDEWGPT